MTVRVGLTGGIGSGKSTVADFLAGHGAVIVDADTISRALLAPGGAAVDAVDEAFPGVVTDGVVDRSALALRVFNNELERIKLEAIIHPLVHSASEDAARKAGDAVVVFDVPLLVEKNLKDRYDVVVVVEAPLHARVARLVKRGMQEADIHARMAAQASDEERRAAADYLILNDGSLEDLAGAVENFYLNTLERDDTDSGENDR